MLAIILSFMMFILALIWIGQCTQKGIAEEYAKIKIDSLKLEREKERTEQAKLNWKIDSLKNKEK